MRTNYILPLRQSSGSQRSLILSREASQTTDVTFHVSLPFIILIFIFLLRPFVLAYVKLIASNGRYTM